MLNSTKYVKQILFLVLGIAAGCMEISLYGVGPDKPGNLKKFNWLPANPTKAQKEAYQREMTEFQAYEDQLVDSLQEVRPDVLRMQQHRAELHEYVKKEIRERNKVINRIKNKIVLKRNYR